MATLGFGGKNILDIVKYRWYWLGFSALLLVPLICVMIYVTVTSPGHFPLKLGIDFTGGSFFMYGFEQKVTLNDIDKVREILKQVGQENAVIQIPEATDILGKVGDIAGQDDSEKTASTTSTTPKEEKTTTPAETKSEIAQPESKPTNTAPEIPTDQGALSKTPDGKSIKINSMISMRTKFLSEKEIKIVNAGLKEAFGDYSVLQVSSIGPSLGKELLKNALIALLLVFGGIVAYLSFRFQLDYALCALFALAHDALFVIGVFSLLGLLFNTEVDSLFVTAILTVIGFSVHDTIVVFDRVRENARFLSKKKSFDEIANDSVNQTLARSINTSMTAVIVLLCLFFFGGVTTKDFVLAMALGIIIGTYSSIFNASVLLTMWRSANAPKQKIRKATA